MWSDLQRALDAGATIAYGSTPGWAFSKRRRRQRSVMGAFASDPANVSTLTRHPFPGGRYALRLGRTKIGPLHTRFEPPSRGWVTIVPEAFSSTSTESAYELRRAEPITYLEVRDIHGDGLRFGEPY